MMEGRKEGPKRISARGFRKIGVKEVLIPGLLLAAALGWAGWKKLGPDIYANKQVFPETGVVREVEDDDTFQLQSGIRVRLLGVDAPNRGDEGTEQAGMVLRELVGDKRVWLEYDRYQDDKYGRVLAWVWYKCDPSAGSGQGPKFLPADYMHLTFNRSREGLTENPEGCKKGKLVQEELVKQGVVWVRGYKDRGELKYEGRLMNSVGSNN
ncbi:MAG: hypothetical protein UY22_C0024G0011 [Candidatus Amesbacteria bacterium GW2011_GWC1_48_10]|uniref:TNase-like domain-containing protein n=1 Tax=Candidatus Amesbacteria bacterium GW2011_GWC1_48_10 TaxID=1618365 RepID=A0A0G1XF39_9BACT|nr:MAG: hypothetical protein UY22_C0024G0011 [Candidatus Amesbacteria bacterium GW2011_GWC1_48_10]